MFFCCKWARKWQRLPAATALLFMLVVTPAAILLGGGVFFPVVLVAHDICGSSETIVDQVRKRLHVPGVVRRPSLIVPSLLEA